MGDRSFTDRRGRSRSPEGGRPDSYPLSAVALGSLLGFAEARESLSGVNGCKSVEEYSRAALRGTSPVVSGFDHVIEISGRRGKTPLPSDRRPLDSRRQSRGRRWDSSVPRKPRISQLGNKNRLSASPASTVCRDSGFAAG